MAIGRHWEWRAFGTLSEGFVDRFNSLPVLYSSAWADVVDEYLWIPDCRINVKLRTGLEDGLKFKRIERALDGFELWKENTDDLYPYKKLNAAAFEKLSKDLRITMPAIPDRPFDRQSMLDLLQHTTPPVTVVKVEKKRQTRRFGSSGLASKVEIAQINAPQAIWSVGIENDIDLEDGATDGEITDAWKGLMVALRELELDREKTITPMSYLKALNVWATGSTLG
jgi:hypothetical protein